MKTLYIIRHAKSSWDDLSLDDFDRPLNKRWKEDIEIIWNILKDKWIKPDQIFCSSAKRAKKTCKVICEKIWFKINKVNFDKKIYNYHREWIDFYLSYIMDFSNKNNEIFIIWHNDAFTKLAHYLLWKDIWNLPTSSVVKIDFNIKKWSNISYWNWKKDFYIFPKMYK